MESRGQRNNNPLNIRHSADQWQGARKEQTDKSFVQFESMAYGYRAAWKTLESYWKHFHRTGQYYNVTNIITRWAPPSENDTEAYIINVLKLGSLGGKEKFLPPSTPSSYGRLCRLMAAMTSIECGIRPSEVDNEAILQGYKLAFPQNVEELDEWLMAEKENCW